MFRNLGSRRGRGEGQILLRKRKWTKTDRQGILMTQDDTDPDLGSLPCVNQQLKIGLGFCSDWQQQNHQRLPATLREAQPSPRAASNCAPSTQGRWSPPQFPLGGADQMWAMVWWPGGRYTSGVTPSAHHALDTWSAAVPQKQQLHLWNSGSFCHYRTAGGNTGIFKGGRVLCGTAKPESRCTGEEQRGREALSSANRTATNHPCGSWNTRPAQHHSRNRAFQLPCFLSPWAY